MKFNVELDIPVDILQAVMDGDQHAIEGVSRKLLAAILMEIKLDRMFNQGGT